MVNEQAVRILLKQECIPVGCILPASVAIFRGGGVSPGEGVSTWKDTEQILWDMVNEQTVHTPSVNRMTGRSQV